MECGLALEKYAEACPVCGTVNPPDAKFCMGCGLNLEEIVMTSSETNKRLIFIESNYI
ncbi:putative OB-fold protein [Methanobacterium petrolearium]|nr:putative OB-fold protein [Methanobacterium petrolearium]BDZ71453.1 hypothetical protein GCM10025861_19700 [Methanobacterium petrolearium]